MSEDTTKVATKPDAKAVAEKPKDIKSLLQGAEFKKAVELSLPSHLKPDRFIRIAITAIIKTPNLAKCDQASFFGSLLTLSQLGLEPDGRRAHLIPFKNRKRSEQAGHDVYDCQLIVDYKGLVELMYRNPMVSLISSDVVCENDNFKYNKKQVECHHIDFKGQRGPVYAAWASIKLQSGAEVSDCMTRQEIEAVRSRSKAANSGPWCTDWNEMAKKTVLRRLSKMIPWPSEIAEAINADDDKPVNLRNAGGPVIEIPTNLITDGSDKVTEDEEETPSPDKPNTGSANLADRLKKQDKPQQVVETELDPERDGGFFKQE